MRKLYRTTRSLVLAGGLCMSLATTAVRADAEPEPADVPRGEHPSVLIGTRGDEPPETPIEPIAPSKPGELKGTIAVKGPPLKEGHYQGVVLGADHLPPRAPKLPIKSGPPRIVWTGFQIKEGVPTLFIELTGQVPYRVTDTPQGLAVHLDGAKAPLRNNLRPLRAGFFETAITDVEAKQQGKALVLHVKRRGKGVLTHRERWQEAPGGYQLLLVEFPGSQTP